jgi:hypothetical protein
MDSSIPLLGPFFIGHDEVEQGPKTVFSVIFKPRYGLEISGSNHLIDGFLTWENEALRAFWVLAHGLCHPDSWIASY